MFLSDSNNLPNMLSFVWPIATGAVAARRSHRSPLDAHGYFSPPAVDGLLAHLLCKLKEQVFFIFLIDPAG